MEAGDGDVGEVMHRLLDNARCFGFSGSRIEIVILLAGGTITSGARDDKAWSIEQDRPLNQSE